jgi:uncharacterized protein
MSTRREEFVATPSGTLRLDWTEPESPRAVVALGHGSATGVEAGDLQALAEALPGAGYAVALITYPYRTSGQASGRAPSALDAAFEAAYRQLAASGMPVIAGGRSAGSQVACRTGGRLGAVAVLALAYPILGPGSARELLATTTPFLVVQGTADPFGVPRDFPSLGPRGRLAAVPGAGHMLGTPGAMRPFQPVVDAVLAWLDTVTGA